MTAEAGAIFRGFARSAKRTPNAPAVIFKDRQWSYQELLHASVAFARELVNLGVHSGDRVAFLARNSDAYVIGFLATQYLGAIHVPINFMLGAGEVAFILGHSAPKALFADDEFLDVASKAVESAVPAMNLRQLACPTNRQDSRVGDLGLDKQEFKPAQLAYTSGTESTPKGALLSDLGLVHQYLSCISVGEYASSDVIVHALPLYHCAQLHCFLMPALFLGSKNVILDRADPAQILQTICHTRATSFFAPPTVWIAILGSEELRTQDVTSLKKGYYGASIMPSEVLRSVRDRLPGLRLWNYYGQTEIGPLATALLPEEHDQRPASAGRPVLFVETRVVDEQMRDVAPGEVGEIVHRSPQLLLRYFRDAPKTEAAFKGGWFHSGDLAIVDEDGYLTIVDRKKDMINSGGENVASREVEEAIYRHPDVEEVAVVGVPDPKWVERVCAVVVMKKGCQASDDDIRAAAQVLAPFKRPKQVVFAERLPKNPSGKVLKRELRTSLLGSTAGEH